MFGNNDKHDLLALGKGWIFKYDGAIWRIDSVNTYIWEEGEKTIEYEVSNNERKAFLEVEDDEGELLLYFSQAITSVELNVNFEGLTHYDEVVYKSERYEFDEDEIADFSSKTSIRERGKVRCVNFEKKKKFVTVEYWDDDTIEYFAGLRIKKKTISNIKPSHLI
jgi:hypothetical protein